MLATLSQSLRQAILLLLVSVAALVVAASVPDPAVAKLTRVELGYFGKAAQPTFLSPVSAAVDQSTGHLLVLDEGSDSILRYNSDGTPAPFSALGGNAIDGAPGVGGKPCGEEASSCDQTPQSNLKISNVSQIAVDNSETETDGNIYVTQNSFLGDVLPAVVVFAASGEYLGQLTGASGLSFGEEEGSISPCGVTVDPDGGLYVSTGIEDKIYKYEPSANPPVNTDHVATFTSVTRPCGLAAGAGPSADALFAEDGGDNVLRLNRSTGELDYTVRPLLLDNDRPYAVAVDPSSGNLLVSAQKIEEYNASGQFGPNLVSVFGTGNRYLAVAVDATSEHVYADPGSSGTKNFKEFSSLVPIPDVTTGAASDFGDTSVRLNGDVIPDGIALTECVFEYGLTASYGEEAPCAQSPAAIGTGKAPVAVYADLTNLQPETGYHFRLVAKNPNGTVDGKDVAFKTPSKPSISEVHALTVTTNEAVLRADVNPQNSPTSYRFEWGADSSYGSMTPDSGIGSAAGEHTVSLRLESLSPGTTYHYRVFAENTIGEASSEDYAFTTFRTPDPLDSGCANHAFRAGAGARLPDCRAYEMVSPLEKNSGDIIGTESGLFSGSIPATYNQAAPTGERLTYSSITPFGGADSAPFVSQFLAERHPLGSPGEGWSTKPISPPRTGLVPGVSGANLDNEFRAFSPDLCTAWLRTVFDPPLAPGAVAGFPNLYRRDNCGSTSYVGLTPLAPAVTEVNDYTRELQPQGFSADGSVAFYIAADDFPGSGAPANNNLRKQLYEYANGELRFVCILPNGKPTARHCSAGTAGLLGGRGSNLQNAVSVDGSRVYWTDSEPSGGTIGQIYLRVDGKETIRVSQTVSNLNARFWGADPVGSRAIFEIQDFLYTFDAEAALAGAPGPSTLIAKGVLGVLGISEDAADVYFASTEGLGGENSEGDQAAPGEPNLYHWQQGGEVDFIGTLSELDVNKRLSAVNETPVFRTSRVTPDGRHAAFMSRAPLTGYDNVDAFSGDPATEVFRYSSDTGTLACVSCNPSEARPIGRKFTTTDGGAAPIQIAAQIPAFESAHYASRVLSDDGSRLFFESYESLVVRDTNGVQDVYQWEEAGKGSCDEGDANFDEGSGGCVELISAGKSPHESTFVDASPNGDDVFFTTLSSLYGPDYGLVDVYDARVDGGFPAPSLTPGCEGEACQGPLTAPNDPTPGSSSFEGSGNVTEPPRPVKCAKGRKAVRKAGRTRCVKKPRKTKRAKRANKNGRAAR